MEPSADVKKTVGNKEVTPAPSRRRRSFVAQPPRRPRPSRPAHHGQQSFNNKERSSAKESPIIPLVGENIRVIPLGGVEEIGMNMSVVEIGEDIIVIDAGFK